MYEAVEGGVVGVTFLMDDLSPRADMMRSADWLQVVDWCTAEQCEQYRRFIVAATDERGQLLPWTWSTGGMNE